MNGERVHSLLVKYGGRWNVNGMLIVKIVSQKKDCGRLSVEVYWC